MRAGIDENSGLLLQGWDHCLQSIRKIVLTRIGTRVMRRTFGSDVPDMQDRSGNARNIMAVYASVAAALAKWEPGFRLRQIRLTRSGADGVFVFEISGVYFENGHLGDYSASANVTGELGLFV